MRFASMMIRATCLGKNPTQQATRRLTRSNHKFHLASSPDNRRLPQWVSTHPAPGSAGTLRLPVSASASPLEKGGFNILFDALPTNGRVLLLLPERERSINDEG